ncbi:hypothetical protein SLH49_08135 [Cognatiyoonia sp. IB215446]|uniref:glycosyltransferase family 2 protein n=1 Tax=Cognatiyoonia sp. IB215446 TaxID=3097355 RepID=UPI002A16E21E|nr:hypothetical protein [Cognatiyoonia sp. IB215446]MDX8347952.1 hypothetical protein [Cognatiyoonia sp. IB215446]
MTHYPDLTALIRDSRNVLARGPIALILVEDAVEVESTIQHHQSLGFAQIIAFCARDFAARHHLPDDIHQVDHDVTADGALMQIVNAIIEAAPGQWIYYSYNAEYLFYPFSEQRSVREMLGFMVEERRDVVASYVVDLYAGDLSAHPTGVAREDAYFDRSGHYALARTDAEGTALDRQMHVFGGLRWRFEEHIALERRRIDRAPLFRAQPGLRMLADRSFNIDEYNTMSCPWHHNLTASVASFRTAKALRRNSGSRHAISGFHWQQSQKFEWRAQQLMDHGWIEPGQWF